jgi:hypothetical protein
MNTNIASAAAVVAKDRIAPETGLNIGTSGCVMLPIAESIAELMWAPLACNSFFGGDISAMEIAAIADGTVGGDFISTDSCTIVAGRDASAGFGVTIFWVEVAMSEARLVVDVTSAFGITCALGNAVCVSTAAILSRIAAASTAGSA